MSVFEVSSVTVVVFLLDLPDFSDLRPPLPELSDDSLLSTRFLVDLLPLPPVLPSFESELSSVVLVVFLVREPSRLLTPPDPPLEDDFSVRWLLRDFLEPEEPSVRPPAVSSVTVVDLRFVPEPPEDLFTFFDPFLLLEPESSSVTVVVLRFVLDSPRPRPRDTPPELDRSSVLFSLFLDFFDFFALSLPPDVSSVTVVVLRLDPDFPSVVLLTALPPLDPDVSSVVFRDLLDLPDLPELPPVTPPELLLSSVLVDLRDFLSFLSFRPPDTPPPDVSSVTVVVFRDLDPDLPPVVSPPVELDRSSVFSDFFELPLLTFLPPEPVLSSVTVVFFLLLPRPSPVLILLLFRPEPELSSVTVVVFLDFLDPFPPFDFSLSVFEPVRSSTVVLLDFLDLDPLTLRF